MTKVTILKARRIESGIDSTLKTLFQSEDRYGYSSRNNEDALFIINDIRTAEAEGDKKASEKLKIVQSLIDVKFELRLLIGQFNFTDNVPKLQNEFAKTKLLSTALKSLIKQNKSPSHNTTNEKFSAGCSDSFINDIQKQLKQVTLRLQDLSDLCSAENVSHFVELSDKTVTTLKEHGLMD